MDENTKNFWEVMQAWQAPETPKVFYRLYHNDDGVPLFYSMEDVPGTYIDIDLETYRRGSVRVRVQNGKLIEVAWTRTTKLVPGTSGSPCHPDNVAVIVTEDQPHTKWSKQAYESN